jgi:hypothetical protein
MQNTQPTLTLAKTYDKTEYSVDNDREVYGTHFIAKSMMFVDANSTPFEIVFKNTNVFNDFTGGVYAINKPCEMCGRIYYDKPMIGIPINMFDHNINGKNTLVINMEGAFHSFECAYVALLTILRHTRKVYELNPVYQQSEHILNTLYSLCYPESEPLSESVKNRAISDYQGYTVRLPNVILMPLKTMESYKKDSIC